jgi:hypothetical protein
MGCLMAVCLLVGALCGFLGFESADLAVHDFSYWHAATCEQASPAQRNCKAETTGTVTGVWYSGCGPEHACALQAAITIHTAAGETTSCTIYGTIATGTPVSIQTWQGNVTSVRADGQSYAMTTLGHSGSDLTGELFNATWLSAVAAACLITILAIISAWWKSC